jgi:hypothetical protein
VMNRSSDTAQMESQGSGGGQCVRIVGVCVPACGPRKVRRVAVGEHQDVTKCGEDGDAANGDGKVSE